jgi:hypothetical protein
LIAWILRRLGPHYLVHLLIDGMHANVFVAGSLGKFAAESRAKKRRIVIVGAWRVSRRDYLAGTSAVAANE